MTDLDARYGRKRGRRWAWVWAVLAIGAGVAWAAWVAFQEVPVSAELRSYDVMSDHAIALELEIHRPKPIDITCEVFAQGEDHAIVGERTVKFAATEKKTVREWVEVETVRRAVTGVLRSCQPID